MIEIHTHIMERDKKEESKRGEASKYIIGSFRGTKSLFRKKSSPSPYQGEGDTGDGVLKITGLRLINNLLASGLLTTVV